MRTLHVGLRVADRERSLAFYRAVGYEVVGDVPETGLGHLTMLKLPDDEFATIAVESMATTVGELTAHGIEVALPTSPDDSDDFLTSWITDPDGNRIELVQWPPGHTAGMGAADFAG